MNENDSLSFAFFDTVQSAEGKLGRYYVAINGKVSQVAVRDDIKTVWDIIVADGRPIYLASLTGLSSPVVVDGDSMTSLTLPSGSTLISCRLINSEHGISANGVCRTSSGMLYDIVWVNNVLLATFPTGKTMTSLMVSEGGAFGVMNPTGKGQGLIYRCGEP